MSKPRSNSMSFFILAFMAMLMLGVGDSVMPQAVPAQQDRVAAILAAVNGTVTIERGDQVIKATFGGALHGGDILKTGADSKAAFIYDSEGGGNGQVWELGPESSIRIGAAPTSEPLLAQASTGGTEELDQFVRDASGEAGLSALPNMRGLRTGDAPEPMAPRNSMIPPTQARFTWSQVDDVLEYRVVLSGEGTQAGSHATTENHWTPEAQFEPGGKWAWQVEAVTLDGSISSKEVSFEVATKEQGEGLAAVQKNIGSLLNSKDQTEVDSGLYLLGTYCQNAGFYNQAIVYLEDLIERQPGRQELHLQLGTLYMAVGQNGRALQQRRLATGG